MGSHLLIQQTLQLGEGWRELSVFAATQRSSCSWSKGQGGESVTNHNMQVGAEDPSRTIPVFQML